jgi:hypothetical protein
MNPLFEARKSEQEPDGKKKSEGPDENAAFLSRRGRYDAGHHYGK